MTRILSALKQIEDRAARERAADGPAAAQAAEAPESVTPPVSEADARGEEKALAIVEAKGSEKAEAPWCGELADAICGQLSAAREGVFLFVAPEGRLQTMDPLAEVAAAVARRTGGKALVADCRGARWTSGEESAPARMDCPSQTSVASVLPLVDAARLMTELRRDHQIVFLVDSYPIDGRTAFLAARCEGVYLVVRLGETARQTARRAVRDLRNRGGVVLGCVLLDLPEGG